MADGGDEASGHPLNGGGAMGARMRAHDWSASPLGPPDRWPRSLLTIVNLMLNSRQPMFLAWGPELGFLYNDAYAPILGARHPAALGEAFQAVWPEIWSDLVPLVERALAGEPTWFENWPLVMLRNGYPEDTWYTFSYSPAYGDDGAVAGMFCSCIETTEAVLAERAKVAERDRLASMFDQAPGFMGMLEGPEHHFTFVNEAYLTLIGHRDVVGKTVAEALPDAVEQGYLDLLDQVYRSGEAIKALGSRYAVQPVPGGPVNERFLDFVYQPVRDRDGKVTGIFVQGSDVTESVMADATVRDNESRLRLVQAVGGVGSFDYDVVSGRVVRSPEYLAIHGLDADDLLEGPMSDDWRDRLHPDDRVRVEAAFEADMADPAPFDLEYRILRADTGETRWIANRGVVVGDRGGRATRLISAQSDITERRRNEEKLRASEEFSRRLLDSSGDCIKVLSLDAELESMNAGGLCVMEIDDFALMKGADWRSFWKGDARVAADAAVATALAGGVGRFQGPSETAKGTLKFWDVVVSPVIGIDGKPEKLLSISRDLSDTHHANRALAERERELRTAIEAGRFGTWSLDLTTGELTTSTTCRANFGRETDQPLSYEALRESVHPDDKARMAAAVERSIATGEDYDIDYRIVTPAGETRSVYIRAKPTYAPDGTPLGMSGISLDTTERARAAQALAQSEAQARIATQAARMGTFALDPRTGALVQDETLKAMFGYAEGYETDGDWLRSVHPDDRAMMQAKMAEVLDPAGPRWIEVEFRAIGDDGVERWLLVRGESRFEGEVCTLYSGVVSDVTERKRAETALATSEARARIALQAARMGVWSLDPRTRVTERDAAAKALFGLPPDSTEMVGWRDVCHPDDLDRMSETLKSAMDPDGQRWAQSEFRMTGRDGIERWVSVRGEAEFEGRECTRFGGVIFDITERKAAEEALRASEQRFRTLAETVTTLVWLVDGKGRMTGENGAWARFTGQSLTDYAGFGWTEAVHPDDRVPLDRAYRAALPARAPYRIEYRLRRADGEYRLMEVNGAPIVDASGEVIEWIGANTDLTEARRAAEAIAESEERFRLIANSAPVPIWVTKLDRTRGFVNDAYCRFVGQSYDDALGFDWRGIIHPDDAPRLLAESIAGEASGAPFTLLGRYRDAAGEWRWLESTSQPRLDAQGALVGFIGVAHDVTEAKQAETRLRESEAELRLVTNSLPVLVSYIDADRRYRFANKAYEDWFGHPVDEIIGHTMREVLGEAAYRKLLPQVDRALAGESFTFDARVPYRDGGTRDVHVQYTPHWADGRVAGYYAMVQDVSDRVAAEHMERKHNAEREAILQQLAEGVIVTDAYGHITFANAAAAAIHGVDRIDTTPGAYNRAFTLLDESGRAFAPDALPLTRAFRDGVATIGLRWRIVRPDGSQVIAFGSAQPVVGPGGGLMGAVLTLQDDTKRTEFEARLKELNETLERRVFDEIAERLKVEESLRQAQKMEAIGKLTGGIAHDFNNLLTVILSSTDLLKRPDLAPEKRERYIAAIGETAQRAAALTSQLLAFARRQPLASEAFEAGARIRALRPMLGTMLGEGVRLTVRPGAPGLVVKADPSQFESAIVNMAVNARDAMPGGGRLTIAVADAGPEQVAITVADTGQGIDPDKLQAIFEPFYTTKAVGKGTGLGLSQVYGFAKQSGGRIDVTSAPGKGTVFTLTLPRGQIVARPAEATGDGEPDCAAPDRPCKVLVVEDNRAVGEFAARLLDDMGHAVTLETEGAAALARIEAGEPFDLVFSDVIMPGALDGLALARKLRVDHPALPVILTTGYAQGLAEDAGHGFEILRKPYSADALAALIAKAVR